MGWCRPRGPTPRRRLRTTQYGSYGFSSGRRSSSIDEWTPDLRIFSRDESRDRSGKLSAGARRWLSHRGEELLGPTRIRLTSGPQNRLQRLGSFDVSGYTPGWEATFAADVEGYSRLMGRDEANTRRTLTAYRVIIDRLIASHRGRIFNTAGDNVLANFATDADAVQCAVEVQEAITKENADRPAGEQM